MHALCIALVIWFVLSIVASAWFCAITIVGARHERAAYEKFCELIESKKEQES